jgi:thiol-disulfide isomerase/thioredoxin
MRKITAWIQNNLLSTLVFAVLAGMIVYQRWPMYQHSQSIQGLQFPAQPLAAIDGRLIEPAAIQKGTVLISFWATWCLPCRVEMPALVSLKEELAAQGRDFEIIAITDEDALTVQEFLKTRPVNFPVVLDRNQDLHRAMGISVFPTLIRLKDGRVESVTHGLDPLLKFKIRHSVLGSYF